MKKFRNRKSVASIDNVLDAFLALKDIDDEEVIGMVRNVKKIDEGVDISLVTSTNAELDDAREFIKNDLMKYLKSALNYGTKWYDFNFRW